jgi:hypothetical protein
MVKALKRLHPESILILGTSDEMVKKIAANLKLPEIKQIIYINDVASDEEIEDARRSRIYEGKHVIPVPTFEIKKDFSGYLLDPLQIFKTGIDKTPYISTIKKEYYESEIGLKILDLIKYFEPDFYTELHCYNLKNYDKLTSMERYNKTGIPPLIKLANHVLVSSVSPLIRMTYFSTDTVCKTLEIPCIEKLTPEICEKYDFNKDLACETYEDMLRLILKSPSREYFEKESMKHHPDQVYLAMKYAKKVFGEDFPPY